MNPSLLAMTLFITAAEPVVERGAPAFQVVSTAPEAIVGRIQSIQPDFAVQLTGDGKRIPAGELVSLRRVGRPLPAWPTQPQLILANGDRIAGVLAGGTGLSVKFEANMGEKETKSTLGLPLSAASVIWLVPPDSDPAAPAWHDREKKQDAMLLRNGDVIRGTLEDINETATTFRWKSAGDAAARPYERAVVAAIALDPSLTRLRLPMTAYARLILMNGSRISVKTATADATTLTTTTLTGAKLVVPLRQVVALDVFQGKAKYLSDMKPIRESVEAYNGISWPWQADRAVKGQALKLAGKWGDSTYDKGLGIHSRTTLVYALAGKYRRFESTVGLDATTGKRGAVVIHVLVDGKEIAIPDLGAMSAANGPKSIVVDVAQAKELAIVVDYGPGGDVQDDVNFADARLIE